MPAEGRRKYIENLRRLSEQAGQILKNKTVGSGAWKDRVLEILFHPFGLMPGDSCEGLKPCVYESFYRSPLRKEEYQALEKLRSGR